MKRQSVAGIIIKTFFKSIGIIVLLLAVGVLSYYLTMLYYNQTSRTERSTTYTHVIDVNTGNESSNLIYSYDKATKEVKAIVLELFDATTKNLNYITIPANTQVTISGRTYAELLEASQKLPQLPILAEVNNYFSGDVAYEYGILILQEELKARIGYFTAIASDQFDTYFENVGKTLPKYRPSQALLDRAAKCTSASDMEDMMEEMWDDLISDATLSQKQNYAEPLVQVDRNKIRVYRAYGTTSGDVYKLNQKKNKKLINNIWESESYQSTQKESKKSSGASASTTSNGYAIQITNGSSINGLASSYQKKLETDGLNVRGVGNYVGGKVTKTVIYAKKKKWAQGLLKYFPSATITVRDAMTNGADIEIVLGTDAALE